MEFNKYLSNLANKYGNECHFSGMDFPRYSCKSGKILLLEKGRTSLLKTILDSAISNGGNLILVLKSFSNGLYTFMAYLSPYLCGKSCIPNIKFCVNCLE